MARHDYSDRPRRDYGDRPRRNVAPSGFKNQKMNPEVYEKRRKVINIIYEAKNLAKSIGIDLPRIQARIVSVDPNKVISDHLKGAIGIAGMGSDEIWIPEDCLTGKYQNYLREVVFHEILHAAYAVAHDETSKLMNSHIGSAPLSKELTDTLFINHIKKALNLK